MPRPRNYDNWCSYCHKNFVTDERANEHWKKCPARMRRGLIPHEHQWSWWVRCKLCNVEVRPWDKDKHTHKETSDGQPSPTTGQSSA